MKKMITALLFIMAITTSVVQASDISIVINGKGLEESKEAVIVDDRVLVPMRAIFEALGAEVTWNEQDYAAYAELNGSAVKIPINQKEIKTGIVNSDGAMIFSTEKIIDVPAIIIDDHTYVPVRAVAEAFKSEVSWSEADRRVTISDMQAGKNTFYYASADDYGKLYCVDTNGARRKKLSDKSVRELYFDNGYIYYLAEDGVLYRQKEDEEKITEERVTDYAAEVVSIKDGRVFCVNAEDKTLHEVGKKDFGAVENPIRHGKYIYYNKRGKTQMFALNIDTNIETEVDMGDGIMLSPLNCVFYNNYILVENGFTYHNIYRFNADGTGKMVLNSNNSFICRNQEEDERLLFVNGDDGQDICYVWIDGSYKAMIADMPVDCAYADVLLQNGKNIYYKNMYRKEIYRTDFDATENLYVGYGDTVKIFGDKLFILGDELYMGNLDGGNQRRIYDGKINDFLADDSNVYGTDSQSRNIIKIGYYGSYTNITNDEVLVWTNNF